MLKAFLVFLSSLVVWDQIANNGVLRNTLIVKVMVWVHRFFALDWTFL